MKQNFSLVDIWQKNLKRKPIFQGHKIESMNLNPKIDKEIQKKYAEREQFFVS